MPHQFKAHPDHPAVAYLVRLHADIGGRILENKRQGLRLAEDMKHVEAVLKMFDPAFNARAIPARRRQATNPWFKRGTLFRHVMDVLRTATEPMTVAAITTAVLASKGVTDATKRQRAGVESGIRASLESNAGKTVTRVGAGVQGIAKRWELAK